MPELPEIETIAVGLRSIVLGHRIVDVVCRRLNLRYPLAQHAIKQMCQGRTVVQILRRGKYMIWVMDSQQALIVHLGMSGRLRHVPSDTPLDKHDHVQFIFADGLEVRYADPRRFGAIIPILDGKWADHKLIQELGPEPLESLDVRQLYDIARKRCTPIKLLLMDQSVIAGLGNIYANEALFRAGIHPLCHASKLSIKQWRRLVTSIRETLQSAIHVGGTTLQDGGFADADGNYGKFQIALQVYGREGEPCYVCHTQIAQIRVSNRSTFFCPQCQASKLSKIR